MASTAKKKPAAKKSTAKAKPAAKKQQPSRVIVIPEDQRSSEQRALVDAINSGPRGKTVIQGPFAVFLHAPAYGQLAQQLGGYVRLKSQVPPRLSEFGILLTAKFWRAQFEWYAHAKIAAEVGVKPEVIKAIHAGRKPAKLAKDEAAVYDFVKELYATRRVSDKTYKRVQSLLGDSATVELVGILGYYVLISMTLNVFRMPVPEGEPLPFPE